MRLVEEMRVSYKIMLADDKLGARYGARFSVDLFTADEVVSFSVACHQGVKGLATAD